MLHSHFNIRVISYDCTMDKYPSAEVVGTDLSPIQPKWMLQNIKFEVDDAGEKWTFKDVSSILRHE